MSSRRGSLSVSAAENSQSNGIEVDKSSTVLNGGGTHSANGDTAVSVTSAGEGEGPAAGAGLKTFRLTSRHRRIAIGLFLTAVGAVCWGVATLSAKRALAQPTFRSPLFLVYFASAWKILIFPAYLVARLVHTRDKFSLGHSLRDALGVLGEGQTAVRVVRGLSKTGLLSVTWTASCYVYARALEYKSTLDAVSLFSTHSSFVYLMSWVLLQKQFIAIRIVAFIVAMTGVVMLTYVYPDFASMEMWGSVLVMVGSAATAVYKILFKKLYADPSMNRLALILTLTGFIELLCLWPMLLILSYTHAEAIIWSQVPWTLLCVSSALALVLNVILHFGSSCTYQPFIISSLVAAIPACAVGEQVWRPVTSWSSGVQVSAYVLLAVAFLLTLLPDHWHELLLKMFHVKHTTEKEVALRKLDQAHMTPRQRLRNASGPA